VPCRYDLRRHACWRGGPVPYAHVANTFAALDTTTKRLRIGDALANMFLAVMALSPSDLVATAYLTVGKIAPEYEGKELQVGGSTVSAAISDATGALWAKCECSLQRGPQSQVMLPQAVTSHLRTDRAPTLSHSQQL
jgi:DNA ligase N terminus